MKLRKQALLVVLAALSIVVGLLLVGVSDGLALLVYVLVVAGLAFVWAIALLRRTLRPAPDFRRLLIRPERSANPVEQFENLKRSVMLAGSSGSDLYRLRPFVRDIVGARLSLRYGIDVDRDLERTRNALGHDVVWRLTRPDAPATFEGYARGWSQLELEQLIDELERL